MIQKISGTKKKIFAGSSLSLFCYIMPQLLKRVDTQSVLVFFKQQPSLTTVLISAVAATSFVYCFIHTSTNAAHAVEKSRRKGMSKRKLLTKPEEKYASLKVNRFTSQKKKKEKKKTKIITID